MSMEMAVYVSMGIVIVWAFILLTCKRPTVPPCL